MNTILVTGGAGYIGSHVCKGLAQAGYTPVVFDNLVHGNKWAVQWGPLCEGDIHNSKDLDQAFKKYSPDAVIHLAGSIHLRESIENPASHYYNNVVGSLSLFRAMVQHEVSSLVFSSSAAVYAPPQTLPMNEDHPKTPINPYGKTKWMTEQIISDFFDAYGLSSVCLRYFNAAGADPDGEIGEAHDPETHLIPRLLFTARNPDKPFTLYNNALNTPDGSAIRDYIHVSDLARGHIQALDWLTNNKGTEVFNLGTGKGYSVLEVLAKVQEITNTQLDVVQKQLDYAELPELVADASKAKEHLDWKPTHSFLDELIETAWKWHSNHLPSLL